MIGPPGSARSAPAGWAAGEVALVTGASAGIGRAVARALAAAGARVLVHGRDPGRTIGVAQEVDGTALVADLKDPAQRQRLVSEASAVHGRVDVLVNNAGVGWSGPFTAMSADRLREVIEVDLVAPLHLSSMLLPAMINHDHGRICFVSSVAGRTAVAGESVYAAAKAGLDAFADSLRLETSGSSVAVCSVLPGAVATDFFTRRGRAYQRRFPRPVPVETVARAVVDALRSDRAEVWVPAWMRIVPAVRAVLPGPYRLLSARYGEPIRVSRPLPNGTDPG